MSRCAHVVFWGCLALAANAVHAQAVNHSRRAPQPADSPNVTGETDKAASEIVDSLFAPFARGATIDFLSFAPGGKITTVLKLTEYAGHGLDVSPNGRTLLFGQMDGFNEDLLLVENVR